MVARGSHDRRTHPAVRSRPGRAEEVEERVLVVAPGRDHVLCGAGADQTVAAVAGGESHQEVLVIPGVLVRVESVAAVAAAQGKRAVGQVAPEAANLVVHPDERGGWAQVAQGATDLVGMTDVLEDDLRLLGDSLEVAVLAEVGPVPHGAL